MSCNDTLPWDLWRALVADAAAKGDVSELLR